jgi:phage/plasmid-like protein (TIGR03299 family)
MGVRWLFFWFRICFVGAVPMLTRQDHKMAHMIATKISGAAAMAFVGETPWHGLGQKLTKDATIETWIAEAGFEWDALTAPAIFTRADGSQGRVNDKMVIYRSDNGHALSVMGDGYRIVQPREVIEFFRDLTESEGWHLHTAGVLNDGARLWAMASNGAESQVEIVKGDRVRANLLLATSLDGSTATVAGMTSVRVVCANTFGQAMRAGLRGKNGGAGARVTHRTDFDAAAVKRQIGVAREQFAMLAQQMQALAGQPCELEQAREILRRVFGQPVMATRKAADEARQVIEAAKAAPAAVAPAQVAAAGDTLAALLDRPMAVISDPQATAKAELQALLAKGHAREQKSVARCLELFDGAGRGADHEGVKGTMWGLLNAVTEHVDHEQGRGGTRLESAWFGRGADFKHAAFAEMTGAPLAQSLASVGN